jgi:GTP-binding protein EngB required for normal cell division
VVERSRTNGGGTESEPLPLSASSEAEFLLAAHVVCAGELVHIQAQERFERALARCSPSQGANSEIEKILALDSGRLPVAHLLNQVDVNRHAKTFSALVDLASVDAYLDHDEIELLTSIAKQWNLSLEPLIRKQAELDAAFAAAKAAARRRLSWRARVVGWRRRLFGREAVDQLVSGAAPDRFKEATSDAWLEYILGSEYSDVVQECVRRAREDFPFTTETLIASRNTLVGLQSALDAIVGRLAREAKPSAAHTAQAILARATKTQEEVREHLMHHARVLQVSLEKKRRSLDRVTIAFLGRTKAGKSTLHAILSKSGRAGIGSGAQRTTRTNRTYEWEHVRIVDTPGFGAAMSPEDGEIARAVLPESDLVCLVVTSDGQQQSDFEVLTAVRELAKPLIIILNFKSSLDVAPIREVELSSPEGLIPERVFREHEGRIRRFARAAYGSDNFDIVPVHLFAALLAQEDSAESTDLWRKSGMRLLLDKIQIAIVDEGPIRRSQTLLGMLPGEILPAQQWAHKNAVDYAQSAELLRKQGESDRKRLEAAALDAQSRLRAALGTTINRLYAEAPKFAETHWSSSEETLNWAWKQKVESLELEKDIRGIVKKVDRDYTASIVSIVEDSATELKLAQSLSGVATHLVEQDTSMLGRTFMKIAGIVMNVIGIVIRAVHPLAGLLLSLGAIIVNWVVSLFESEDEKRAKAAKAIQSSLRAQIAAYHAQVETQLAADLKTSTDAIHNRFPDYFRRLTDAELEVNHVLADTTHQLKQVAAGASRLYAKRVWDWARQKRETLTHAAVAKAITGVERDFGVSLKIMVHQRVNLKRDEKRLSRSLQESVTITRVRRKFWG